MRRHTEIDRKPLGREGYQGIKITRRMAGDAPFVTDEDFILDLHMGQISDAGPWQYN